MLNFTEKSRDSDITDLLYHKIERIANVFLIFIKFFIFNISQTFRKQNKNKRIVEYTHNPQKMMKEVFAMNRNDQQFMVENIRTQYTQQKQSTDLEELRALDAKVKRPANAFAYIFGSIGALIMGSGMSLVMTDLASTLGIANPMLPGVVIGVVGLIMVIINYPLYNGILGRRKKKYADKILTLSEKIMNP